MKTGICLPVLPGPSAALGRTFLMAKLILEINGLRMSIGDRELLNIPSMRVYEGERVGLIGQNGAGKSTLLSLIAGETEADAGTVRCFGRSAHIHQQGDHGETVPEGELRSLFRAREAADGLSGGERTRRRIAAALSARPALLLADEPTTDLDEEGVRLLLAQLKAYPGALILVSHDRALLRALCTRIWHLENGTVTDFPGGYDGFQAERSRRRERAQFEYDQYRREQKRLKESAQKMAERASSVRKAPSRMGNSEARLHKREATDAILRLSHAKRTIQNRMEQMEAKERPAALPDIRMALGLAFPIEAKTALTLRCDRLEAGGRLLLTQTEMNLPTGSRTALTGENGCGKTTLLSAITGRMAPGSSFTGEIRLNPKARIGWFDQHHERTLRMDRTVLENVLEGSSQSQAMARTVLSRLGFSREDAFKQTAVLSGGEKAKAALAQLLLRDLNLLILDEPTNHLDLFTMEALEDLLADYGGTLLCVTHDETFLQKTATRRVRFENRKLVTAEDGTGNPEKKEAPPPGIQERDFEIMKLEMQLADLSARLARPQKGDRPDLLNEEYLKLAEDLQRMKRSLPGE